MTSIPDRIERQCDKCGKWKHAQFSFFTERMWFCNSCKIGNVAAEAKKIAADIPFNVDSTLKPGQVMVKNGTSGKVDVWLGEWTLAETLQALIKESK